MPNNSSINVYANKRLQELEEEESRSPGRKRKRKKNPATGRDMYGPDELRSNNPYNKPKTGR